jgi:hypothetical protein
MFAIGAGSWQAGSVLIEHRGSVPQVHSSAYVAPTAVICGAVRIGPETRVPFGATAATGSSMRALPEETKPLDQVRRRPSGGCPDHSSLAATKSPQRAHGHARSVAAGHRASYLLAVLLGAYFVYSAVMEERYMAELFPDAYPRYKQSTKMLVPFIF